MDRHSERNRLDTVSQTLAELTIDSDLVRYAEQELGLINGNSETDKTMERAILDVIRLIATQGHSGHSANYLRSNVQRLLNFMPLKPLWDNPGAWEEVGNSNDKRLRHKRYSALFRSPGEIDRDVNAATFYVPGEGYGFTNIQLIIMYQKLRPIKYPYTPPSFPAIVKCGRDKDGKAYIVKIEQEARR